MGYHQPMNASEPRILVVDDEEPMRKSTLRMLKSAGYSQLYEADRGEIAQELIEKEQIDLVFLDITMPGQGGEATLDWSSQNHPDVPVVMITGRLEGDIMLRCLKMGAYDYITKPFEPIRISTTAEKALLQRRSNQDLENLQDGLFRTSPGNKGPFQEILTGSENMTRLFAYAESSARSDRDMLITGETGTGKDLFARAVHQISGRNGQYVPVNAAGLDDQLFADTLFGHLEGAFTGANSKRAGLIEKAEGGTLFLDEIGDLSIPSQVKLLRVLQEREFMPLGSDKTVKTTARVVAATSVDLHAKMEEGTFRKDLYFRLKAHHLHIPPLRARKGDIKLLFNSFLDRFLEESGKSLDEPISPHSLLLIESYPFPGNIRELEAMVYDLVYKMESNTISLLDIKGALDLEKIKPTGISARIKTTQPNTEQEQTPSLPEKNSFFFPDPLPTVDELTDALILEALDRAGGNKTQAAAVIGMSRKGLLNRLNRMDIPEEDSE